MAFPADLFKTGRKRKLRCIYYRKKIIPEKEKIPEIGVILIGESGKRIRIFGPVFFYVALFPFPEKERVIGKKNDPSGFFTAKTQPHLGPGTDLVSETGVITADLTEGILPQIQYQVAEVSVVKKRTALFFPLQKKAGRTIFRLGNIA